MEIEITFPDGTKKKFKKGILVIDVAKSISQGLARTCLGAKLNGVSVALETPIDTDATFKLLTFEDTEGRDALRHSCAHLLAAAIMELWPDTKRTIGPAIDEGFYFDFEFSAPIHVEDFEKIEQRMREILPTWKSFERHELTATEAKKEYLGNQYKHELIDEFSKGGKKISFYKSGSYWDLCKGGHIFNPDKNLKYFKLVSLAGAYWRGDEKNPMLTRIYGMVFPTKKQLDEHLNQLEEAKKRDHRILGKRLDLFSFHDVSPGSPFFHPKGSVIYLELQRFLREQYGMWGYQEVITPLVYHKELWEQSGHWQHYQEHMFHVTMDNKPTAIKPMNCPSHILIFKTKTRSYRDLPMRITDFAPLHRNELKGVLGGLTRVRKFSQDDCHVFCTQEHVKQEITAHIQHCRMVYQDIFGFDFSVELSTKPDNAMGDSALWELAEQSLKEALIQNGVKYKISPGEGAFYGPKIDFHIKDTLGRTWQCGTEQLDFQQPERFAIEYEGHDGKKHKVAMLHRTVLGSLERFMGLLIEHFAGKFPVWLAPVQIRLMTVADRNNEYAKKIHQELTTKRIRTELDDRSESIPKKVHDAQVEYIPLMVTIGDKEQQNETVAVRTLDGKVYFGMKTSEFLEKVLQIIAERKIKVEL